MKKVCLLAAIAVLLQSCSGLSSTPLMDATTSEPAYLHLVSHRGETLALISRWYTGSETNWPRIQSFNHDINERPLSIGSVIYIPDSMVTERKRMPKWHVEKNKVRARSPSAKSEKKTAKADEHVASSVKLGDFSNDSSPELQLFFPDIDNKGDAEMIERRNRLLKGLLSD
jgi:hypothetical protein